MAKNVEVICPNCKSRMIYYKTYYYNSRGYKLAYCPECKLGCKLVPKSSGRECYSELSVDKIERKLGENKIIKDCKSIQCNECGADVYYELAAIHKGFIYALGYCNKCGNIELRDPYGFGLEVSFPYTPKFNPNYRMLLGNGEVIDSPFTPATYTDKIKERAFKKINEIRDDVVNIVDQVISENFCIKYCIGNRDEYCDEIDCARNKIINKLKLKLKEHGKLE